MNDVWSPCADRLERTRRDLPERELSAARAVVVHTTGSGIVIKALKKGADPLNYAAEYYARPRSFCSHYLVGHDAEGGIIGTVPEGLIAYHSGVASKRVAAYKRGRQYWMCRRWKSGTGLVEMLRHDGRYRDWAQRWPQVASPLDLVPRRWVNKRTVGVDLLAPLPGSRHPNEQIVLAAGLINDVCERLEIPIAKGTILRHSDVDPLTRSTKSRGGWDPPRRAFEALCECLGVTPW